MIKSHDHDLAELRFGSGHRQNKKQKKNNKSRVKQEPRSAHGRAVKKIINPVQSKNRARPMAARLIIINPVQSKNRARPMAARLINPV